MRLTLRRLWRSAWVLRPLLLAGCLVVLGFAASAFAEQREFELSELGTYHLMGEAARVRYRGFSSRLICTYSGVEVYQIPVRVGLFGEQTQLDHPSIMDVAKPLSALIQTTGIEFVVGNSVFPLQLDFAYGDSLAKVRLVDRQSRVKYDGISYRAGLQLTFGSTFCYFFRVESYHASIDAALSERLKQAAGDAAFPVLNYDAFPLGLGVSLRL